MTDTYLFSVPRPAIREWAAGIPIRKLEQRILQMESSMDSIRGRIKGQETNPEFNHDALLLDKLEDILVILEVELAIRNFMEDKL